jgi:amino acid adenylation domain-containing protein
MTVDNHGLSAADRLRREIVAHRLAAASGTVSPKAVPTIPPADRSADLPASFAQEQLWLVDRLDGHNGGGVRAFAHRVPGGLDRGAWQGALDDLVARHEVLRTALVEREGRPTQHIADQVGVPLAWHDSEPDLDAARAFAGRPFDLATAPLVRAAVWASTHDCLSVIALHHVACDGWSVRILIDDLAALYRARVAGGGAPLPPLPVQYADYAVWQRDRVEREAAAQLDHWCAVLADLPVLELPTDRPRPPVRSGRGGFVEVPLPGTLVTAAEALAHAHGATLFMVLLAAYQTVLARWSGQTDIAVGTPAAGRDRTELEELIGCFLNTLVLRGDLTGTRSFATLLKRTRERVLDAFDHQDVPFERIVARLRPERDLSRTPLFQAWLALQNYAVAAGEDLLRYVPLDDERVHAPFDLSLMAVPTADGGLTARFTYAADLFDAATVARLAGRFVRVFTAAVADPTVDIWSLALTTPAERTEILAMASSDTPPPMSVTAAGTAAVALVHGTTELTYSQLDALVGGLATRLPARAVVGVCVPRGVWSVVAMLAAWRVGGVYVPLDPAFPTARLRELTRSAGVDILVAEADPGLGLPVVMPATVDPVAAVPEPVHGEHELAYVIFTSGSSGQPKAVGVEHGALSRHVAAIRERFGITAADRVLAFSSFTFDASLDQLLPALAVGATVVLRGDEPWLPTDIPAMVARHGVTVVNLAPTFWAVLASTLADRHVADLAPLRLLILGGEAIPPGPLAAWRARVPHVRVLNAYGPTETTVTSVLHEITRDGPIPIGRPVGGRRVYVVDGRDELAPVGIPGELLIGGPELARGYLGQPGQTAARFVPDPFGGNGSRLYRTGDRARWLRAGTLEFLGRTDEQVNIRGVRVELGEVEAVLSRCPGVLAAAVAVRPDAQGRGALVAYAVPMSDVDTMELPGTLRTWCADHLPSYLVPSEFVPLDALPVGAGGKLIRAALPTPTGDRAGGAGHAAPRDTTERLVAEIWAQVLGVERVGLDDNFFELGGHSLLAMMAVSRVADRLGRAVELRTLFEHPTVRTFAPRLAMARIATSSVIVPVDRSGALPMSFAQERMWFLDRVSDTGADYLLWFSWRVRGELDREALQAALDDVVARHEVLRTALVEVDGRPAQQVWDSVTVPLEWSDMAAMSDVDTVRELASEFAVRRFDLAEPPMVRCGVWRLGVDDQILLLTFHHVATDGWSQSIFLAELAACYHARRNDDRVDLPRLPVQYADFAVWQRDRSDAVDARLDWWRSELSGLPTLDMPTDRPRIVKRLGHGTVVHVDLDAAHAPALTRFAHGTGATPFMVLLAAFWAVLGRWSGQDDIPVGTPVAGRDRVDLEPLIGCFVNTLVLRGDLRGDPSFHELVERARHCVLSAADHQDMPFEKLVADLRPERDLSRNPLFQVMFDVQAGATLPPALPGLVFEQFPLPRSSAKFDLTATFLLREHALAVVLEYRTDLFAESSVRGLAGHLNQLLAAVLADPRAPVARADLLSSAERTGLLARAASGVVAERAPVMCDPDAVALVCDDTVLTHGELDVLVGGLATRLTPGAVVGVCVPRGIWTVVAMLAAWRAGGVYVPLDPALPPAQLRFMVAEAGVTCVIAAGDPGLGLSTVDVHDVGPVAGVPEPARGEHDLAYVIFTSGSSGRPKAVGVEHGALSRHVATARDLFGLTAADRVLSFASSSFDASLEQVLPALSVGARVVLRPDELWSPEELADRVRADRVTVMELTPAYWAELVARLDVLAPDLASLRLLVSGGEALPAAPLRTWFSHLPEVPVVNTYGPTESVISATAHLVTGPVDGSVPIGRPLGERRVYVVDARGQLVPAGVPGELMVGGVELARGYLGRPSLTAERFIPDPFGGAGGRLYRTGDRVRWLAAGSLEFLGRVDDQVKIRGVRIEPGEIEAVLRELGGVRDAVVVVRDGLLVAYLVTDLVAAELAEWCRAHLPGHSVPAAFVPLATLPLTVQGKVDLAALPAPRPPAPAEFVAPVSPTEVVTAQVWAEVLGVDQVGRRDDFFALGGHSLRAVTVASRLRAAFGCPVRVRDLFDNPTVELLAAEVERQLVAQIAEMSEDEIDISLSQDGWN